MIAKWKFIAVTKHDLCYIQALHGEQYLELYRPLQPNATLKSDIVVADVLDKKSGALIIVNITTSDEKGAEIRYTLLNN